LKKKKKKLILYLSLVFFVFLRFGVSDTGAVESITAEADFRRVFQSGTPFVFGCSLSGISSRAHPVLSRASAAQAQGPAQTRTELGFAAVDCDAVLPSGKTVRDRFGLGKEGKGALYFTVGATGVTTVPEGILREPDQQKMTERLLVWARAAAEPKLLEVTQSDRLEGACFGSKRKVCGIVLGGESFSPLGSPERRGLNSLMRKWRAVQFVFVNATRSYFTSEVTGTKNPGDDAPSLVVLSRQTLNKTEADRGGFTLYKPEAKVWVRVSTVTHFESLAEPKEASALLERVLSGSAEGMVSLTKLPLVGTFIRPKTPAEKAADERRAKAVRDEIARNKAKKGQKDEDQDARAARESQVLTDKEVEERRAAFKKKQAARERERREKMEDEGKDLLEQASEGDTPAEEEEFEAMEL
jgi:hypothetical protein